MCFCNSQRECITDTNVADLSTVEILRCMVINVCLVQMMSQGLERQ